MGFQHRVVICCVSVNCLRMELCALLSLLYPLKISKSWFSSTNEQCLFYYDNCGHSAETNYNFFKALSFKVMHF